MSLSKAFGSALACWASELESCIANKAWVNVRVTIKFLLRLILPVMFYKTEKRGPSVNLKIMAL